MPKKISNLCQQIKKVLNLKDLAPHQFRHTYATNLLNNGVDLETIRLLLGHSDYNMLKRYIHIKNKSLEENSIKANSLIKLQEME